MDKKSNFKNETIQVLEEKKSEFIYNWGIWKGFLTMTQDSDVVKQKIVIFV